MDRNEFIRQCGFACAGVIGLSSFLQSCTTTRQLNAPIANNQLVIPLSAFQSNKRAGDFKRFLVVRNEQLNFPLVVYREQADKYTALLLRCSHQYTELNVNGELLTCPAHGSEFDAKGNVVNGPAEEKLRSFSTSFDNEKLYIHLV